MSDEQGESKMATATTEKNGQTSIVPAPKPVNRLIVHDEGPLAFLLDTGRFEHMQRIASTMARGTLTPQHLRGGSVEEGIANCTRICNQAFRWGMDPFAIMDSTYVVQGKLGYEGKLVAAVVNARAGLTGRLSYLFSGEGDNRTVTVSGRFLDEPEPRTVTVVLKTARTKNTIWQTDPDQKLCYTGAIKWARRHCPEVVLGVLTDDDLERIADTRAATYAAVPAIEGTTGGTRSEQLANVLEKRKTSEAPEPAAETKTEPPKPDTALTVAKYREFLGHAANDDEVSLTFEEIKRDAAEGLLTEADVKTLKEVAELQAAKWSN